MSHGLRKLLLLPATVAPLLFSASSAAHILVTEPPPRIEHDNTKTSPCGENAVWGSGGIATFSPGEQVTLQWNETILHPGYFRVVLSLTGDEALTMPSEEDLDTFKAFYSSGSGSLPAPIEHPNGMEVDGLLFYYDYYAPHGSNECAGTAAGGTCTYQVTLTLPSSCEQCTLQLVQAMAEPFRTYGVNAHYYHCVDFTIEGDDAPATGDSSTDTTGETTNASGTSGGTDATTEATSTGTGGAGATAGASTGGGGSTLPAPTSTSETPVAPAPPPLTPPPTGPGSAPPPTTAAPPPATTTFPLTPPPAGSGAPVTMAETASGDAGGCSVARRAASTALDGWWLLVAAALFFGRRAPGTARSLRAAPVSLSKFGRVSRVEKVFRG